MSDRCVGEGVQLCKVIYVYANVHLYLKCVCLPAWEKKKPNTHGTKKCWGQLSTLPCRPVKAHAFRHDILHLLFSQLDAGSSGTVNTEGRKNKRRRGRAPATSATTDRQNISDQRTGSLVSSGAGIFFPINYHLQFTPAKFNKPLTKVIVSIYSWSLR